MESATWRIGQQLAQRCNQCVGIVVSDDGARAGWPRSSTAWGKAVATIAAATREGIDQHNAR